MERASHFQIHSFNSRMDAQEAADLAPFYAPLGCGTGGARDRRMHFGGEESSETQQQQQGRGARHRPNSDKDSGTTLRKQCMFATIMRSLIKAGPGRRLRLQKAWLRGYYRGSDARFDAVLAIDKRGDVFVV